MPPIQAAKPGSGAVTGLGFHGELLQHLAFEHLDLALGRLQSLLAEARQLQPALVRFQRLLERELAAFIWATSFSSSASAFSNVASAAGFAMA